MPQKLFRLVLSSLFSFAFAISSYAGSNKALLSGEQSKIKLSNITDASCVEKWSDRVIPMPRKIEVTDSILAHAGDVCLQNYAKSTPEVHSALWLLREVVREENNNSMVTVTIGLADDPRMKVPQAFVKKLKEVPNSEQAYLIYSNKTKDGKLNVYLAGNTDIGILYAANTWYQLCNPNHFTAVRHFRPRRQWLRQSTQIEIPVVNVIDWPAIKERGFWRWSPYSDNQVAWFAQWKINLIDLHSKAAFDKNGMPVINDFRKNIAVARGLGVGIRLHLSHITQRCATAFRTAPDLNAIHKRFPGLPVKKDLQAGELPLESEDMVKLLYDWLKAIAEQTGNSQKRIDVWLTESGRTSKIKAKCGRGLHTEETLTVIKAFRRLQKDYPDLKLSIWLSQGCFKQTGDIIKVLPDDVGLVFYDGGRTYTSGQKPIIYPLLQDFAASGRYFGVVPQFNSNWLAITPMTSPQFVRFRAKEFAEKGVDAVYGYFTPDNHYYEFNTVAMAEYLWNPNGRSPKEFAKAYALTRAYEHPELYAEWVVNAGEAAWHLAASRILFYLRMNPDLGMKGKTKLDHRFEFCNISGIKDIGKIISKAEKALAQAKKLEMPEPLYESKFTLAGLKLYDLLKKIFVVLQSPKITDDQRKQLAGLLNQYDYNLDQAQRALLDWSDFRAITKRTHRRVKNMLVYMLKTRETLRGVANKLGITDPRKEFSNTKLYAWNGKTFEEKKCAVQLNIDITDIVGANGGNFAISSQIIKKTVARLKIIGVRLKRKASTVKTFYSPDNLRVFLPQLKAGDKLVLDLELTCRALKKNPEGSIYIRRLYKSGEFPVDKKSKIIDISNKL